MCRESASRRFAYHFQIYPAFQKVKWPESSQAVAKKKSLVHQSIITLITLELEEALLSHISASSPQEQWSGATLLRRSYALQRNTTGNKREDKLTLTPDSQFVSAKKWTPSTLVTMQTSRNTLQQRRYE